MEAANFSTPDTNPKTVHRQCGGWLAVAPATARFRIAVTADTEDEAIERFRLAQCRWAQILTSPC